jgi:CHC2 zinc finger
MVTCNSDLKEKIAEAKRRLPLRELMTKLGLGEHAKKSARCPFPGHEDKHPSFSVFRGDDGFWHFTCFSKCGDGDEIMFLSKLKGLSLPAAMTLYLDMAGFPVSRPSKSREYPKCPESPMSLAYPVSPVSPVSKGQALDTKLEKELKALAAQNACTQLNTARPRRFKLLRDLKAVQKRIGCKLQISELTIAFHEWHQLSLRCLDPTKTRDHYEAKFLSEFSKVRFATGDGRLMSALENVVKLSPDQLPEIPGKSNAPESWRRLAALHRELSRLRGKPTHFLAYRDAARVFDGMSHQEAHAITGALKTLGVIKIVDKGKAGLNSREAAEFRYLLTAQRQGRCNGFATLAEQAS